LSCRLLLRIHMSMFHHPDLARGLRPLRAASVLLFDLWA
jgi:hypothetical protein